MNGLGSPSGSRFSSQRSSLCFRPVLSHTNLLSHGVMNVRCIYKISNTEALTEIPCSRRIGYNVGAITGVHAKNSFRALHSFSGFHFDYSPWTQKIAFSHVVTSNDERKSFATLVLPLDVMNYDTDLFLGTKHCHSSTHSKISSSPR